MDERINRQSGLSRFITWMMGVFAGIALWLCALGVYGVMSYMVTQRTREIGIRLALGAQPREVLRAIIGSGAGLIVAGIAIGSVVSVALRRIVSTQLLDIPLTRPGRRPCARPVRARRPGGMPRSRPARDAAGSRTRAASGIGRYLEQSPRRLPAIFIVI
jgi:ABC-type antimicrobial peptide transport system permease subunit